MTKEYLESSHAAADGYRSYLVERYQGEVYGEALFHPMAAGCNDAERVGKLRLLERLERETKEFLRPALVETGGLPTESAKRIREGQTLGSQLASAPWADLMQGFQQEIQRFVEEFEAAESLAPAGQKAVLQHVTAHERALLLFATRELEGNLENDSLEPVIALFREDSAA